MSKRTFLPSGFLLQDEGASGRLPVRTLTTALSSTIGTGNIIGGTALALGGPEQSSDVATGIFGMATKYTVFIAAKYRVKSDDGSMIGGADSALERGLKMKWLGIIFAFLAAICAGPDARSGKRGNANITANISVSPWVIAAVLTVLVGLVIIGGLKIITRVSEILVPFMAIFYFLGCLVILIINRDVLDLTIVTIVNAAFSPQAMGGGFIGSTVLMACRYGFARGLFSNESGMGSAPLVAAAAQTRNPKRQALVSMTGTFWDTVVICLMTGLVLVSCIIKYPEINGLSGNGAELTSLAFGQILIGVPAWLWACYFCFHDPRLVLLRRTLRCLPFGERVKWIYKILWVIVFLSVAVELNLI